MDKVLSLIFISIFPLNVFASDGNLDWHTFGWRVAMFVVFVALLYKFAHGAINKMLVERTEEIKSALNAAEVAKAEAQKQVEEYQSKMKKMEQELEEMKANAKKVADAEREAMLADANRQVEQMKQFAINMIEAEAIKAKNDLHKEIVTLAAAEAEKNLKKEIAGDKAEKVLNDYVKHIGE